MAATTPTAAPAKPVARGAAAGAAVLVGGGSDAVLDGPVAPAVLLPPPMLDDEPVVTTVGMGTGGTSNDEVAPPETVGVSTTVGIETGGMETGGKTVLPLASVGSTGKVTRPVSRPTVVVGSRVSTSPIELVMV